MAKGMTCMFETLEAAWVYRQMCHKKLCGLHGLNSWGVRFVCARGTGRTNQEHKKLRER